MKSIIYTTLFAIFLTASSFVTAGSSDVEPFFAGPKLFVSGIALEENESQILAKIVLTNGVEFCTQLSLENEEKLNRLQDELLPGAEVFFFPAPNSPFLYMYSIINGKLNPHCFSGFFSDNSKNFLLKITDIQDVIIHEAGKIFNEVKELQITLEDGSIWTVSFKPDLVRNYWKIGDHVIYSNSPFHLFINIDAPFDVLSGVLKIDTRFTTLKLVNPEVYQSN